TTDSCRSRSCKRRPTSRSCASRATEGSVMANAGAATILYRIYELPWSTGAGQDEKFRKTVRAAIGAMIALALVIALLPVPKSDQTQAPEVPKRLAKLVLERKAPPPPPPVVEKAPEQKPEPVEQKQVKEEPPKPKPKPEKQIDKTEQAREKAKVAGLLPFAQ